MPKPLIYLAGPYTKPDPIENISNHAKIGVKLIEDNIVTPVVPHCTMVFQMVDPHPVEFWYQYDLEIMERCDAVLRLDKSYSLGADKEVEKAKEWGIPVFYSVESLYEWCRRTN